MPNDHTAQASAATAAGPVTDHRKRPRRRGDVLNAAIFEATLAELAEVGYPRLSMERVAERARASKASLYRRWPGKLQLVMDTVYHRLGDPVNTTDTGSLRGDLLAMLRGTADQLAGPAGQAMRGLLSDVLRDSQLAAQLRAYACGNSLKMMQEVVRRATERGELDAGSITTRQLETGHALMRFHFLTNGAPIPDSVIIEIVDEVILPLFRSAASPDR